MKIKTGDTVMVITGKDKGKSGKVLRTIPEDNRVVVEGVNIVAKHKKPNGNEAAEIKHFEAPIDASNVMYYDKSAKKVSRVGYEVSGDKKVRVAKATGKKID